MPERKQRARMPLPHTARWRADAPGKLGTRRHGYPPLRRTRGRERVTQTGHSQSHTQAMYPYTIHTNLSSER